RWALGSLGGWTRAQIKTTGRHQSVRTAFREQQLTSERFLDIVIDRVEHALQDGVETPQALLASTRSILNIIRRTGRPPGRPRGSSAPLNIISHPRALDQADFDAWTVAERAGQTSEEPPHGVATLLGAQELQVYRLWLKGFSIKETAAALGITV